MGVCSVPPVPDWNNAALGELCNGLSGNREAINKIQLEFTEASNQTISFSLGLSGTDWLHHSGSFCFN